MNFLLGVASSVAGATGAEKAHFIHGQVVPG
jgi:hypothetical protein